jgi:Glycosyl transferase family 21
MLTTAIAAGAGAALVIALTAAIQAALFRAGMLIPTEVPAVPVTLLLPATGPLPGLEELFAALLAQTLPPARVIVAVESRDDPAYQRVVRLARRVPGLAVELVVAGVSDRRAQKCTNILAAVERLGPADGYIVLCDADIRPQPWWLAALVGPLAAGQADLVNGYRWPVPQALSAAALLGTAIDRAIATLPRIDRFHLLWGGSLALSRHALDLIDLPASLAHTLSDDLAIGRRAAELGLRIVTRRGVRAPTPLGGAIGDLWRFGRRQYQIIHVYRPEVWLLALAITTADLLARTTLVAAAVAAAGMRQAIAVGGLVALALIGSVAIELLRAIGRRLGIVDPVGFALAQHLLPWSVLPCAAFHAGIVWAGIVRSPVTWAHVRYRLDGDGRVVAAARALAAAAAPSPGCER